MAPPIALFLTTIASQPALRQRQEYLLRTLQVKKIKFAAYDLASDEQARKLWKRKAPPGKQDLPGFLVGNQFIGTVADLENAVESNRLSAFLRVNDQWDEGLEREFSKPPPEVVAVGVPGAYMPSEMTGQKPSFNQSGKAPERYKEHREGEIDMAQELPGMGLEGVKVTEAELTKLAEELNLIEKQSDDPRKSSKKSPAIAEPTLGPPPTKDTTIPPPHTDGSPPTPQKISAPSALAEKPSSPSEPEPRAEIPAAAEAPAPKDDKVQIPSMAPAKPEQATPLSTSPKPVASPSTPNKSAPRTDPSKPTSPAPKGPTGPVGSTPSRIPKPEKAHQIPPTPGEPAKVAKVAHAKQENAKLGDAVLPQAAPSTESKDKPRDVEEPKDRTDTKEPKDQDELNQKKSQVQKESKDQKESKVQKEPEEQRKPDDAPATKDLPELKVADTSKNAKGPKNTGNGILPLEEAQPPQEAKKTPEVVVVPSPRALKEKATPTSRSRREPSTPSKLPVRVPSTVAPPPPVREPTPPGDWVLLETPSKESRAFSSSTSPLKIPGGASASSPPSSLSASSMSWKPTAMLAPKKKSKRSGHASTIMTPVDYEIPLGRNAMDEERPNFS